MKTAKWWCIALVGISCLLLPTVGSAAPAATAKPAKAAK